MQEYAEEKTVALVISGGKMSGRVLAKAMRKFLAMSKKGVTKAVTPHGKQTVRQLSKQNAGLSNIEINEKNIKSFERVARKYGVDFALKKDRNASPPKWLVFFKARDADALTAAFEEYSGRALRRDKRPSLMAQLNKFQELVKNSVIDRVRNKDRGGHER